jgi:hypothetical protein
VVPHSVDGLGVGITRAGLVAMAECGVERSFGPATKDVGVFAGTEIVRVEEGEASAGAGTGGFAGGSLVGGAGGAGGAGGGGGGGNGGAGGGPPHGAAAGGAGGFGHGCCAPPGGDGGPEPSHVAALYAADDAASANGEPVNLQAPASSLSWIFVVSSFPNSESEQEEQAHVFAFTRMPLFAALQRPGNTYEP